MSGRGEGDFRGRSAEPRRTIQARRAVAPRLAKRRLFSGFANGITPPADIEISTNSWHTSADRQFQALEIRLDLLQLFGRGRAPAEALGIVEADNAERNVGHRYSCQ